MSVKKLSKAVKKHLWEINHPYYCEFPSSENQRGYENARFRSFSDFMKISGQSDFDMNFLFRWDWEEGEEGKESGTSQHGEKFTGDINYRNGVLKLFYILQRKGLFRCDLIDVCLADEVAVIKFLEPRFLHMKEVWNGIL